MYCLGRVRKFLLPSIAVLLLPACADQYRFNEIPEISFTSMDVKTVEDTLLPGNFYKVAQLRFSFQDKEGDIGLEQGDTLPPYHPNGFYDNVILSLYGKVGTEFVFLNESGYRVPENLSKYSSKNGLKGYIEFGHRINNPDPSIKILVYDIYIMDRALHKSNIIRTPEIVLD